MNRIMILISEKVSKDWFLGDQKAKVRKYKSVNKKGNFLWDNKSKALDFCHFVIIFLLDSSSDFNYFKVISFLSWLKLSKYTFGVAYGLFTTKSIQIKQV